MKIQIEKPVKLNDPSMKGKDVLTIKSALNNIGYYDAPDYGLTEYPDRQMFNSIRTFQKDKNLQIDGVINPGRETINEINNHLKISAKSPTSWCTICGGPHGGSEGDVCPSCFEKLG